MDTGYAVERLLFVIPLRSSPKQEAVFFCLSVTVVRRSVEQWHFDILTSVNTRHVLRHEEVYHYCPLPGLGAFIKGDTHSLPWQFQQLLLQSDGPRICMVQLKMDVLRSFLLLSKRQLWRRSCGWTWYPAKKATVKYGRPEEHYHCTWCW